MAIKTFSVGKVAISGTDMTEVHDAPLSVSVDTSDRTAIGDSWRELGALGKSWTLSLTCAYNPTATVQAALRTEYISGDCEVSSVEMWEDASHYFYGNAIITSFNVTKSVGSDDELSVTLEGNGALNYS